MTHNKSSNDTKPVRTSENLDWQRLAAYLRRELAGLDLSGFDPEAEMQVEQFPGGLSNLTYLIRFGAAELVMRRPPFGPVPPRAHDVARESRVLAAVHPHFPLAPRPLVLCEDMGVIGSVFYVMERRHGMVIRNEEPPQVAGNEELRNRISGSVIDTLADLHDIDVVAHGLESLGKPAGFMTRQIKGWIERWQGAKTREVGEMEALARWLEQHTPADVLRPTLVHGDYKLDNVMLDAARPDRVIGVFDWEMSAIGDPLVDVGIVLAYWVHLSSAGDESISTVTSRPGWFGRSEILDRYSSRTERNLDSIPLYEVFAVFKTAVVVQQIFARYARGQTDDPRFGPMGAQVVSLARLATELTTRA